MQDEEDPRTAGEYVRRLSTSSGDLTIVGVVHDHPASEYRVRQVIEQSDPDVLALELPPLAVPLFSEYSRDSTTPPTFGGEMSTAIQAADTDRVVGIDGPSLGFAGSLVRKVIEEDHSLSTAQSVLQSLTSVTKHAIVCRLAATLTRTTGLTVQVDSPVEHDCDWTDDPAVQAEDEHSQVRRAQTIMSAFGTSGASDVRKTAREGYMADRLATLSASESIVAVVGVGHLDELVDRLAER